MKLFLLIIVLTFSSWLFNQEEEDTVLVALQGKLLSESEFEKDSLKVFYYENDWAITTDSTYEVMFYEIISSQLGTKSFSFRVEYNGAFIDSIYFEINKDGAHFKPYNTYQFDLKIP